MSEWRRRCEREATIEATTGYGYVYGVCTMVVTELYFRVCTLQVQKQVNVRRVVYRCTISTRNTLVQTCVAVWRNDGDD